MGHQLGTISTYPPVGGHKATVSPTPPVVPIVLQKGCFGAIRAVVGITCLAYCSHYVSIQGQVLLNVCHRCGPSSQWRGPQVPFPGNPLRPDRCGLGCFQASMGCLKCLDLWATLYTSQPALDQARVNKW